MMIKIVVCFLKTTYRAGSYSGKKEEIIFLPGVGQFWLTSCVPVPSVMISKKELYLYKGGSLD
jgi:hypothetical protein